MKTKRTGNQAASDVSQVIFKPMYDYVTVEALQHEYNVDPETVRILKEAGIDHVSRSNSQEGNKVEFAFEADNKLTAQLMEHAPDQVRIVQNERVEKPGGARPQGHQPDP